MDQTDASESMVSKEAVKMTYELPPSFEDITTLNELPNAQSAKSSIVNRNSKELSHSTTITEPVESSEESKPTMDQSNRRDRIKNANANSAALLGNVHNINNISKHDMYFNNIFFKFKKRLCKQCLSAEKFKQFLIKQYLSIE